MRLLRKRSSSVSCNYALSIVRKISFNYVPIKLVPSQLSNFSLTLFHLRNKGSCTFRKNFPTSNGIWLEMVDVMFHHYCNWEHRSEVIYSEKKEIKILTIAIILADIEEKKFATINFDQPSFQSNFSYLENKNYIVAKYLTDIWDR